MTNHSIAQVPHPETAEIQPATFAAGVYRAGGESGNFNPESVRVERIEHGVGSLVTGEAVGMAALPEQYAAQQLHRFNFTREDYAAFRANEAAAIQNFESQMHSSLEDDDDEAGERENRKSLVSAANRQ
jgi:hypothetical protein